MLMFNGQTTLTYSCESIFSNVRLVGRSVNWSPLLRFTESNSVYLGHVTFPIRATYLPTLSSLILSPQ
jgi:hypothetical protein